MSKENVVGINNKAEFIAKIAGYCGLTETYKDKYALKAALKEETKEETNEDVKQDNNEDPKLNKRLLTLEIFDKLFEKIDDDSTDLISYDINYQKRYDDFDKFIEKNQQIESNELYQNIKSLVNARGRINYLQEAINTDHASKNISDYGTNLFIENRFTHLEENYDCSLIGATTPADYANKYQSYVNAATTAIIKGKDTYKNYDVLSNIGQEIESVNEKLTQLFRKIEDNDLSIFDVSDNNHNDYKQHIDKLSKLHADLVGEINKYDESQAQTLTAPILDKYYYHTSGDRVEMSKYIKPGIRVLDDGLKNDIVNLLSDGKSVIDDSTFAKEIFYRNISKKFTLTENIGSKDDKIEKIKSTELLWIIDSKTGERKCPCDAKTGEAIKIISPTAPSVATENVHEARTKIVELFYNKLSYKKYAKQIYKQEIQEEATFALNHKKSTNKKDVNDVNDVNDDRNFEYDLLKRACQYLVNVGINSLKKIEENLVGEKKKLEITGTQDYFCFKVVDGIKKLYLVENENNSIIEEHEISGAQLDFFCEPASKFIEKLDKIMNEDLAMQPLFSAQYCRFDSMSKSTSGGLEWAFENRRAIQGFNPTFSQIESEVAVRFDEMVIGELQKKDDDVFNEVGEIVDEAGKDTVVPGQAGNRGSDEFECATSPSAVVIDKNYNDEKNQYIRTQLVNIDCEGDELFAHNMYGLFEAAGQTEFLNKVLAENGDATDAARKEQNNDSLLAMTQVLSTYVAMKFGDYYAKFKHTIKTEKDHDGYEYKVKKLQKNEIEDFVKWNHEREINNDSKDDGSQTRPLLDELAVAKKVADEKIEVKYDKYGKVGKGMILGELIDATNLKKNIQSLIEIKEFIAKQIENLQGGKGFSSELLESYGQHKEIFKKLVQNFSGTDLKKQDGVEVYIADQSKNNFQFLRVVFEFYQKIQSDENKNKNKGKIDGILAALEEDGKTIIFDFVGKRIYIAARSLMNEETEECPIKLNDVENEALMNFIVSFEKDGNINAALLRSLSIDGTATNNTATNNKYGGRSYTKYCLNKTVSFGPIKSNQSNDKFDLYDNLTKNDQKKTNSKIESLKNTSEAIDVIIDSFLVNDLVHSLGEDNKDQKILESVQKKIEYQYDSDSDKNLIPKSSDDIKNILKTNEAKDDTAPTQTPISDYVLCGLGNKKLIGSNHYYSGILGGDNIVVAIKESKIGKYEELSLFRQLEKDEKSLEQNCELLADKAQEFLKNQYITEDKVITVPAVFDFQANKEALIKIRQQRIRQEKLIRSKDIKIYNNQGEIATQSLLDYARTEDKANQIIRKISNLHEEVLDEKDEKDKLVEELANLPDAAWYYEKRNDIKRLVEEYQVKEEVKEEVGEVKKKINLNDINITTTNTKIVTDVFVENVKGSLSTMQLNSLTNTDANTTTNHNDDVESIVDDLDNNDDNNNDNTNNSNNNIDDSDNIGGQNQQQFNDSSNNHATTNNDDPKEQEEDVVDEIGDSQESLEEKFEACKDNGSKTTLIEAEVERILYIEDLYDQENAYKILDELFNTIEFEEESGNKVDIVKSAFVNGLELIKKETIKKANYQLLIEHIKAGEEDNKLEVENDNIVIRAKNLVAHLLKRQEDGFTIQDEGEKGALYKEFILYELVSLYDSDDAVKNDAKFIMSEWAGNQDLNLEGLIKRYDCEEQKLEIGRLKEKQNELEKGFIKEMKTYAADNEDMVDNFITNHEIQPVNIDEFIDGIDNVVDNNVNNHEVARSLANSFVKKHVDNDKKLQSAIKRCDFLSKYEYLNKISETIKQMEKKGEIESLEMVDDMMNSTDNNNNNNNNDVNSDNNNANNNLNTNNDDNNDNNNNDDDNDNINNNNDNNSNNNINITNTTNNNITDVNANNNEDDNQVMDNMPTSTPGDDANDLDVISIFTKFHPGTTKIADINDVANTNNGNKDNDANESDDRSQSNITEIKIYADKEKKKSKGKNPKLSNINTIIPNGDSDVDVNKIIDDEWITFSMSIENKKTNIVVNDVNNIATTNGPLATQVTSRYGLFTMKDIGQTQQPTKNLFFNMFNEIEGQNKNVGNKKIDQNDEKHEDLKVVTSSIMGDTLAKLEKDREVYKKLKDIKEKNTGKKLNNDQEATLDDLVFKFLYDGNDKVGETKITKAIMLTGAILQQATVDISEAIEKKNKKSGGKNKKKNTQDQLNIEMAILKTETLWGKVLEVINDEKNGKIRKFFGGGDGDDEENNKKKNENIIDILKHISSTFQDCSEGRMDFLKDRGSYKRKNSKGVEENIKVARMYQVVFALPEIFGDSNGLDEKLNDLLKGGGDVISATQVGVVVDGNGQQQIK